VGRGFTAEKGNKADDSIEKSYSAVLSKVDACFLQTISN